MTTKSFVNRKNVESRLCEMSLTHKKLALALGISRTFLSQLLNGKRSAGPNTTKKFCEFFKCDYEDVFIAKHVRSKRKKYKSTKSSR